MDDLADIALLHLTLAKYEHIKQVDCWIGRSCNEICRLFNFYIDEIKLLLVSQLIYTILFRIDQLTIHSMQD